MNTNLFNKSRASLTNCVSESGNITWNAWMASTNSWKATCVENKRWDRKFQISTFERERNWMKGKY